MHLSEPISQPSRYRMGRCHITACLDMTTGVEYSEEYAKLIQMWAKQMLHLDGASLHRMQVRISIGRLLVWDQILSLKSADAEHGERFLYRSIEQMLAYHDAGIRITTS